MRANKKIYCGEVDCDIWLLREIGIGSALTKRPPFTIPLSCCRSSHAYFPSPPSDCLSQPTSKFHFTPGTWQIQELCKPANPPNSPPPPSWRPSTSRSTLTRWHIHLLIGWSISSSWITTIIFWWIPFLMFTGLYWEDSSASGREPQLPSLCWSWPCLTW